MFEKIKRYLTISPGGAFLLVGGSIIAAGNICAGYYLDSNLNYIIAGVMSAPLFFFGSSQYVENIRSYNRVLISMRQHGYDHVRARKKMLTPCEQTALRAAAEDSGNLEKYIAQCSDLNIPQKPVDGIIKTMKRICMFKV